MALSKLLPREDKFYRLVGQLSAQACACARYLRIFVETENRNEREEAGRSIAACRTEAKKIMGDITRELCLSYITPLDREDIQEFSVVLYKITKITEKISNRLEMHGISNDKGDFSRQIDLIVQEAEAMRDMVDALIHGKDSRRILDKIGVLQDLEHRGDAILDELLVSLFKNRQDAAADLILRKDIYDMLEKVIDRYRDAAGIAMQIVLKHS